MYLVFWIAYDKDSDLGMLLYPLDIPKTAVVLQIPPKWQDCKYQLNCTVKGTGPFLKIHMKHQHLHEHIHLYTKYSSSAQGFGGLCYCNQVK